jgi:peptidyl-prolyl cis-trans isomerase SurA
MNNCFLPLTRQVCVILAALTVVPVGAQVANPRVDTQLARPPSAAGTVLVDRIVAVVNEDVITSKDLAERSRLIIKQLSQQGASLPPADVLRTQITERMINDLVQVQLAKESGIRIDDATVERTLTRMADENNVSMTQFRSQLEADGVNFQRFREDMRTELTIQRLREREVEGQIIVTDAEVESQIAQDSKELATEKEFNLQHILVVVPTNASPEQIDARRRRALQALSELRKGEAFTKIAATYSDAPDALSGGNLGWRPSSRLPTIFVEAINKVMPGETTGIIQSPNGFHIVKLLEQRGRAQAEAKISQTRARHILLKTRDTLSDDEAKARLTRLRERIAGGADFGELAKVHSEDTTAARGGDLGWLAPGETVPEFERALNSLRDNELSQPVQSPYGWHLIQVVERRAEDLSDERRKNLARQPCVLASPTRFIRIGFANSAPALMLSCALTIVEPCLNV